MLDAVHGIEVVPLCGDRALDAHFKFGGDICVLVQDLVSEMVTNIHLEGIQGYTYAKVYMGVVVGGDIKSFHDETLS